MRMDCASLSRLKSSLQQAADNSSLIQSGLGALEKRLSLLDEKLCPVRDEALQLSVAKGNIERTINILREMSEYFVVADEVDRLVKDLKETVQPEVAQGIEKLSLARRFFFDHRGVPSSTKVKIFDYITPFHQTFEVATKILRILNHRL